jgi:hypothetical protein
MLDGKTTYQYFLFIPDWALGPTFSVFDANGPLGPSNSPCPNSTVSDISGQDNAPGANPGPGERTFLTQFAITPGVGATGGQTPQIGIRVDYAGAAAACVSPPSGNFGDVQVGQTVTKRFTVTNCGHADLVIDHLEQDGGQGAFSIKANLCEGATIPPGGSCTFDVDFAPTEVRDRVATIRIVDNAGDSPQAITVDGSGVPAPATGGGGGPPQEDCPGKPGMKRPCADVYISGFRSKGTPQDGDHQDVLYEIAVTNRGPDRAVGEIEAQTRLVDGVAAEPVRIRYDLAPGETLVQPAGAHIVSDDPFTLTVRIVPTTADPDPSNNGPRAALIRPPATQVKSASRWSIRGIAQALADLFGADARATAQAAVTRVDVAVLRLGGRPGTCRWLRDKRAHFKTVKARGGRCDPSPVWLKAKATTHWSLGFRRSLPPGRYVAYSRARDALGIRQVGFSKGEKRAFRVSRR